MAPEENREAALRLYRHRSRSRSRSPSSFHSRHRTRSRPQYRSRSPPAAREVCANSKCRRTTHTLKDCIGPPSPEGDIIGCPICNTEAHIFDFCDKARGLSPREIFDYLGYSRSNKPPFRSSFNVLMLASYVESLTIPNTKSYSLLNWRKLERDPSLPPRSRPGFANEACRNWTKLTRELCYTDCTFGPDHAANYMTKDDNGFSGFDFIPFNLLRDPGAAPGRNWYDHHRRVFTDSLWGFAVSLPRDIDGCDDDARDPFQLYRYKVEEEDINTQQQETGDEQPIIDEQEEQSEDDEHNLDHPVQPLQMVIGQDIQVPRSQDVRAQDLVERQNHQARLLQMRLDHEFRMQQDRHAHELRVLELKCCGACRNQEQDAADE